MKQTTKDLYKLLERIGNGLHGNHIKSEQQLIDRARSYKKTLTELKRQGLTRTGQNLAWRLANDIETRVRDIRRFNHWL